MSSLELHPITAHLITAPAAARQATNKDAARELRENEKAEFDLLFVAVLGLCIPGRNRCLLFFLNPCLFLADFFVALAHLFIFQCGLPKFHLLKI